MIKKILSILLIIYFFTGFLYAQNTIKLVVNNNDVTAISMNTGQDKFLIDKIYYIKEWDWKTIEWNWIEWTKEIGVYRKKDDSTSDLYIHPSSIKLTCLNGYISWINSSNITQDPYKSLYVKFTKSVGIYGDNTIEYYLQVKCKPDFTGIINKPISNIEIKEKDVSTNNKLGKFSISSQYIEIPESEAIDKLMKPNPVLQPKFVEILYYQTITIDQLMNSLENLWVDINTSFVNTESRDYYNQWVNRLIEYNNVQSFADDFESPVTLKDIWIADNIAKSLSARLLCEYKNPGTCSEKITIVNTEQFKFYTLKEILTSIYGWTNSTSDNIKGLYEELKKLNERNYDEISDPAEKSFVSKVMKDTFWDMVEHEDFAIWYGLQTRINNIDILKSTLNLATDDKKVNIQGIFNFYYEFSNASKWYHKTIELGKAIGTEELENAIKGVALQDVKNKLSLLGDNNNISGMDHNVLTWNITKDLQNLLRINEEDFTLSLIGCTPWTNIGSFLNYENIKTSYDYYNLLEWLISKAYSSTNRKIKESPDTLYSEGLYNIEGKNNISIHLSNIWANSTWGNSFGYYFANSNKEPIKGKVIFNKINLDNPKDNFDLAIISSEIPSDASYIGFWLWANTYNSSIENWDDIIFEDTWMFSSGYHGKINNNIINTRADNNAIYFSHTPSNPDGEWVRKEWNNMNWEDKDGSSGDYNDLTYKSSVLISDYYSIYLDMSALKDTVYEKYFNITECYNTVDDPNLILYYNSDSFMNGGSLITNLAGENYNGYVANGSIIPTDNGLYFGGNDYIKTSEWLPIWEEITIEIKADITSLEDQVLWEYWTDFNWINVIIRNKNLLLGGWTDSTCKEIWKEFKITELTKWPLIIKVILTKNSFKLYLDWVLKIDTLWYDITNNQQLNNQILTIWANWGNTRFDKLPDNITCDKWGDVYASTDSTWKLITPNYFQWTIKYIKIWNIAKYPESLEPKECYQVQKYTMANQNEFYVHRNKATDFKELGIPIPAGSYKIKLKVERSADQFLEKFDFYALDDINTKIKVWNTSFDHPDTECHNDINSQECIDAKKRDCEVDSPIPRSDPRNGCRETIAENVTFTKEIRKFEMKYPNPDGVADSSSHIMEIIVEQCQ